MCPAEGTHWGPGTGRGLDNDLQARTNDGCINTTEFYLVTLQWSVNQPATLETAVSLASP